MTPSWYDVLSVEPDADQETIRAAWREAIDGLEPSDRRFRSANRAAEVLLDPARRAEHDAELAAQDADDETDEPEAPLPVAAAVPPVAERESRPDEATRAASPVLTPSSTAVPQRPQPVRLLWTTAVVGVVAVAMLVLAIVAVAGRDDSSGDAATDDAPASVSDIDAARAAAEAAAVPVLSYDYRTLDEDKQEADSYLTDSYREQYDQLFESAIRVNAPSTKTVVTAEVLASGVVRTAPDRVDVLLFVNRPVTNKQRQDETKDQVTMRMVDQGGTWLVDCMITQPGGTCG